MVLVVLAVYRLTRLVVFDDFPPVQAVKRRVIARFGAASAWATLLTCPFCLSVWVAAGVVLAVWPHASVAALLLRFSGVAGGVALVFAALDDG